MIHQIMQIQQLQNFWLNIYLITNYKHSEYMGCSSSKDAKDLSPLKTSKVVVAFELKCKICYTDFDKEIAQPMVIPCGHTLCKNCLMSMPKSQCPYDRMKFEKSKCQKNYQILGMINQKCSQQIKIIESSFSQKVVCQKKHSTKWSGQEEICTICHQNGPGFKCSKCNFNRCDRCVKRKPTKICYNGHKTRWSGIKMRCVQCRENSSGWQCLECKYSYCHTCSKTEVQKGFCPNGHNTHWNPIISEKINCSQCQQLKYGFVCQQCNFSICKTCAKHQFINTRCPNNHLTVWLLSPQGKIGNLKCQNCNQQSHGFACQLCCFLLCTQCCGWKFQFTSSGNSLCPNNHQSKWIQKITNCMNKCGKVANERVDGFICPIDDCGFELCRPCTKLKPVTRSCFNKHLTIWSKDANQCMNCSLVKPGWCCRQCDSNFCSQCTSTSLIGNLCPNFHKKVWNCAIKNCDVCKQQSHGWFCQKCQVFSCSTCQKTNLSKGCPNKHQILINESDIRCISCKQSSAGWKCKQCSYECCLDCVKGRINSVSCPFYHALKVIVSEQGMSCKRCKQSFQSYSSCDSRCLILCQECVLRK